MTCTTLDQTEQVRHVIYFSTVAKPASIKVPQDKKTIQFILLNQLEEQGQNVHIDEQTLNKRLGKQDIAVLMYTSGGRGTPKGIDATVQNLLDSPGVIPSISNISITWFDDINYGGFHIWSSETAQIDDNNDQEEAVFVLLSCQMSTDTTNLFLLANTLSLCGYKKINCIRNLVKSGCSISSLVPWSLLTHIEINHSDVITQHTLQSLLYIAHNVHTLEIIGDRRILLRMILHNKDNFGTRINQQIKSLIIYDASLTLQNVQRFCTLLSNQFTKLKTLWFTICDSYGHWQWKPSRINDGKNKSTKRIVNVIYLLVNHLQELVWLRINFSTLTYSDTPCFPHLIRRQLHQYPLSRPCRLRCSNDSVQIWL
ncbi:unnamed protein product [Rotaria sordida]|uniref:Uncharacterized protein n=1 Tax=Rotaria sordida TaxID=392033 RepID=A0A818RFW1_9BILA|nr:unnamed protein product [Rotaria sordida]